MTNRWAPICRLGRGTRDATRNHGTDLSKQTGLARGAGVAATVQATYSSTPLISTATHSKRKAEPKATEQKA
jgi:hypothetical protein